MKPHEAYPSERSQSESFFDLAELDRYEGARFLAKSLEVARQAETDLPAGHNDIIEVNPVVREARARTQWQEEQLSDPDTASVDGNMSIGWH